ncbi:helix-turn-helix family protein [Anoxybacillus sp. B7M1]|jgi:XRE family transcriptional regulator, regulator of sulfur utilization|uniref:Helix-turn-helix transcriptional regulator n=1 Tax=Anoxybacteroides rupiense TaxID=311460 RepID=A0ABD5IX88_9BACL|nr:MULTISPECIES: helix-turn-helix transcriptional regulator [Anoxybacillus]ANB56834.1 helix-turn-helix family protein [Anoxybacillus sp. B2M1]ANB62667.1 helix-turn-helix family protein [Anoxybacillus sp. B7M1]KXG09726.1 HTH-type transcriptional regulator DdrOP3 [Anoxybacillus sp. P3H1B]MBB3908512.1 transcriptional regulator with XRE-family HTH domain [Anoxybacillus rupiensis]MBS2770871.1 helix-turn-helix transcriptional regulator [Anoxybacillus rupiensis]
MSDLPKIIGERIRKFRKEKGLSQEELAHMANLHTTYIGQLERGEKNATLGSIEKVANALDISLEELFRSIHSHSDSQVYTLSQIITHLQAMSVKDQKTILKLLEILLEWKEQ